MGLGSVGVRLVRGVRFWFRLELGLGFGLGPRMRRQNREKHLLPHHQSGTAQDAAECHTPGGVVVRFRVRGRCQSWV